MRSRNPRHMARVVKAGAWSNCYFCIPHTSQRLIYCNSVSASSFLGFFFPFLVFLFIFKPSRYFWRSFDDKYNANFPEKRKKESNRKDLKVALLRKEWRLIHLFCLVWLPVDTRISDAQSNPACFLYLFTGNWVSVGSSSSSKSCACLPLEQVRQVFLVLSFTFFVKIAKNKNQHSNTW